MQGRAASAHLSVNAAEKKMGTSNDTRRRPNPTRDVREQIPGIMGANRNARKRMEKDAQAQLFQSSGTFWRGKKYVGRANKSTPYL